MSSDARQTLSFVIQNRTSSRRVRAETSLPRMESFSRLFLSLFQQYFDNIDILGRSKGVLELLFGRAKVPLRALRRRMKYFKR